MLSSVSRGDEDVDGVEDPPLLVESSTSFEALVPIELRAPCFPSGSMMDSSDTSLTHLMIILMDEEKGEIAFSFFDFERKKKNKGERGT